MRDKYSGCPRSDNENHKELCFERFLRFNPVPVQSAVEKNLLAIICYAINEEDYILTERENLENGKVVARDIFRTPLLVNGGGEITHIGRAHPGRLGRVTLLNMFETHTYDPNIDLDDEVSTIRITGPARQEGGDFLSLEDCLPRDIVRTIDETVDSYNLR